MKKILLIFLLLLTCGQAYALENDGRLFKYYKINKVLGEYKDLDDNNLFDLNDFKKSKLSDVSVNKPELKNGRNIYEYDGYHYLETLKVNCIRFTASNMDKITNLTVGDGKGELSFEKTLDNDVLLISLDGEYNLNDLYLSFKSGKDSSHEIKIEFLNNDIVISCVASWVYSDVFAYFMGKDYPIYPEAYKDVYSKELLDDNYLTFVGKVKLYDYEDYQYRTYKLEKEYYSDYLKAPFGEYVYKDESDYIDCLNNSYNVENNNDNVPSGNVSEKKLNYVKSSLDNGNFNNKKTEDKTLSPSKSIYYKVNRPIYTKTDNKKMDYKLILLYILILLLILMIKVKNRLKRITT